MFDQMEIVGFCVRFAFPLFLAVATIELFRKCRLNLFCGMCKTNMCKPITQIHTHTHSQKFAKRRYENNAATDAQ